MTSSIVRRTVRSSALYDLIISAPFALPFTAPVLFDVLGALHHSLGLSGLTPSSSDPYTVMFANLMGSIVVVWSVLRLVRPDRTVLVGDAVGRGLFSLGMLGALLNGASTIVAVMLVLEILWGVVQTAVAVRARGLGSDRANR